MALEIPHLDPLTFSGLAGEECDLFKRVLAGVGGKGVEIGCLDGFSSCVILTVSDLHLTSVDPLVADSMESSLKGNEPRLLNNLKPFGSRWTFVKDFSEKIAPTWTEPLDFLFIDGDHAYEAVLRDYNQWVPLLKQGGIFAIHDFRMSRPGGPKFHPGPSRVAQEKVYDQSAWQIIGEGFSLTVAKKL